MTQTRDHADALYAFKSRGFGGDDLPDNVVQMMWEYFEFTA